VDEWLTGVTNSSLLKWSSSSSCYRVESDDSLVCVNTTVRRLEIVKPNQVDGSPHHDSHTRWSPDEYLWMGWDGMGWVLIGEMSPYALSLKVGHDAYMKERVCLEDGSSSGRGRRRRVRMRV
jgi:hypothetical protein